ncbi:MAG: NAD(P)-dependent oxidoreductase [Pseudomonadota bacterium]
MAKPRLLLVTERSAYHQEQTAKVVPEGVDLVVLRSPSDDELKAALVDATYMVSERVGRIDGALLDAAPHLKLILRLGSLSHDIDLAAAKARGVIVCQRFQEGTVAVAEFTLLQVLALLHRLPAVQAIAEAAGDDWAERRRTDEDTFAFNWSKRRDHRTLDGMTIGILGMGEIGAVLAARLLPWDVTLLYARRRRLPDAVEAELHIGYRDDETLLAESDVVVCLLPYNDQTVGFLDGRRLASMKQGAYLVSAGSGGVIEEAALADVIASGHLAGAAIDTFAVEPIEAGNPLVTLARDGANVILTPHVAGGAPEDPWADYRLMFTALEDHLRGDPPAGRIA